MEKTNAKNITLGGERQEYPNLKKGFPVLRTNIVLHVEAYGCVCWKAYDRPRFAGINATIFPGDRNYLKLSLVR